ncbi:MAG: oligosaccharide flippase family protein, partial [Bacteroidota bacterium]
VLLCGLLLGYSSSQMGILALLAGNQVLASALLYLRSNLAGLHLFRQDSLLSVLDRAILVVFMAALLWWPGSSTFQMEWLVWGQTMAYGLSVIAALALVARHAGGIRFRWDGPQARRVLRESMPFALLILLSGLALRMDSVLLERIDTARAAGDYAMGFRFFDAVTMVAFLFAGLLLPIFSRMHER